MIIKEIKISNFKSFKNLDIVLGNFVLLIGANASGKSNFIQVFQFLRDILRYGLDNAISMQGGSEYLRNINIGPSENFSLEVVVSNLKYARLLKRIREKGLIGIDIYETIYKFAIKFRKKGRGFEIAEDKLIGKFNLVRLERQKRKIEKKEKLGQGEILLSNVNGKIKGHVDLKSDVVQITTEDVLNRFLTDEKLPPKTILLNTFFLFPPMRKLLGDISIYDFDSKLPKKASPITGKSELEEDGSNLAIVLENIIEKKDKKRKLSSLVKDLLPFIDNLGVEKFADKSLLFKLKEIYAKKQYIPASLVSDGTINITALIVALYFEEKPLTIIEEPERNIHPYLISKVTNMIKEASQNKQIIVTTHNPEMVKYAGLKNILLINRDKDSFSYITRPSDKAEIKTFLKNEMGIEELYVQNLLEI